MFRIKNITLLLILCLFIEVYSSPCLGSTEDSPQLWSSVFVTHNLNQKFGLFLEVQNRFAFDLKHNERLLMRPAAFYNLNDKFSFWLGYGWTPLFAPSFKDEQRVWQQMQASNPFKLPFDQLFRLRFEQRIIEGVNTVALRVRLMTKFQYVVFESLPKWSLVAFDELFLNLNTAAATIDQGFDQNRIFLGLGYKFSDHVKTEFGYLNDYINRTAPMDRIVHAGVISLFLKI